MDAFFDFNQGANQNSPTTTTSRTDAMSPFDQEEQQQFNGPSHDYGQFKQQVGLPVGSLANMPQAGMYDGFNSGIGDVEFNSGFGWNSGIDMDADMTMDYSNPVPPMFYPSNDGPSPTFVDPNTIGGQEEPTSRVGQLWPGMHSQHAQQMQMQKQRQAQAAQQQHAKRHAQKVQHRHASNASQEQPSQTTAQPSHNHAGKRASYVNEPHVEESISRLLNQMRQNNAPADDAGTPSGSLPHIARMKKDEEEMDEDERLLASEEGKRLSSKERRQLRNKVSARAFRSRRKGKGHGFSAPKISHANQCTTEYIGQLEGEVALKAQESNVLRQENQALLAENERYRGLIETLLRHPAFTPFINDISNDPSSILPRQQQPIRPPPPQQQQQQPPVNTAPNSQPTQQQAPPTTQPDMKPGFPNFDASQLQIPQSQPEQSQVNLAMIPEESFNKLNIHGFQQGFKFNQVNAYAVTEVPTGPDPVELLANSPARLSRSAAHDLSTSADSGLSVLLTKLDRAAANLAVHNSLAGQPL
jgi:hypothetical protein